MHCKATSGYTEGDRKYLLIKLCAFQSKLKEFIYLFIYLFADVNKMLRDMILSSYYFIKERLLVFNKL